jgi:hypothetical protein
VIGLAADVELGERRRRNAVGDLEALGGLGVRELDVGGGPAVHREHREGEATRLA